MFNHITNKEKYISFEDDNYLSLSYYGSKENVPLDLWFTFNKIEIYVNGSVEIIGNPSEVINSYTDYMEKLDNNSL